MNPTLTLGTEGYTLPIELATGSIALLATKGAGKTYAGAVLTEELVEHGVPVCSIDITGAHYGLKSSATGRSAGLPFTVFGGDHADLPLERGAGEVIARWFVERRFCAIIDLSHFSKEDVFRFLTPFFSTIYRLNRQPVHLICDEADAYVPQKVTGDRARCVGAMEDLVRRGRFKGIGSTLISQRPASVNKDVLTQCDCLMAMRIVHPRDIDPVMEWVNVQADPTKAQEMIKSLPGLPTGTAWIWAPRFDILDRVKIRRRRTFDSSQTPEIGQQRIEPEVWAKVDLEALGAEISATAQRAKENDPPTLKAKIAQLQAELARKPAAAAPERVEVPILTPEAAELISKAITASKELESLAHQMIGALQEKGRRNTPCPKLIPVPRQPGEPPLPRGMSRVINPANSLSFKFDAPAAAGVAGTQQKILDVLAMLEVRGIEPNADTVARWLSLHPRGGRYTGDLAALRRDGYLDGWALTASGQSAARPMETGFEASQQPLEGTQRAIMQALRLAPDDHPTAPVLAEILNLHPRGGRFTGDLARLRTMGLITPRGPISLTEAALR